MTEREFMACYIHYLDNYIGDQLNTRSMIMNAIVNANRGKKDQFIKLPFEERIKVTGKKIVNDKKEISNLFAIFGGEVKI
ncbi:hypothetical protein FQS15_06470 [Listeria innocua]|nr:hypothetical protein [Listeria innocua]